MSSDKPIIEVREIGKRYWVGGLPLIDHRGMHSALEQVVRAPYRAIARRLSNTQSPSSHAVPNRAHLRWAIRNVSFNVAQGEVLGIVGQNGAGKSVLLKLLSRITCPTEGYARLGGSVSCMLEAGVGFHPELTGRENIRLSGAILGMSKYEIESRMDEIISFADIDEYLDTPVKHYSSGMFMRLGFAVVAHMEADIMLIDEVMAVGDEQFTRRSVEKMRSIVRSGKTILFVSHDLDALEEICDRAILLRNGGIEMDGAPDRVVAEHKATGLQ